MAEGAGLTIPDKLAAAHQGWQWEMVWSHVSELNTWRLTHPDGRTRFLKLTAASWEVQAVDEAKRMRWLQLYSPVPHVIDHGEGDGLSWLLTEGLPGRNAIDPGLLAEPAALVAALGRGLRRFHDGTPAAACPFRFTNEFAMERVRERVRTRDVTAAQLERLESLRPATEDLVVCHGDPCLPNFLVEDGEVTGYVDLGDVSIADRWRDIAIALWSVTRNLGPGWEDVFLRAYGVERDEARVAFYQELYWRL